MIMLCFLLRIKMSNLLTLSEMTIEEKLYTMEQLWDDLCHRVPEMESPEWHLTELGKRETALQNGETEFIDWETAKLHIKQSIL